MFSSDYHKNYLPIICLWNQRPWRLLMIPNWSQMIKGSLRLIWNQFGIIQNAQMSQVPQANDWEWTFFEDFATRILKYECISSFHRTTINKVDVLDLGIMWLMAVEIANIIKLYQPPFRARSRPWDDTKLRSCSNMF